MQSQTGNGQAERRRQTAGSPNAQATRRKTGNAVKMVGTKKTNIECGITQVTQRRIGYPRYQGEPRKPSGDVGEPDVRRRKNGPCGHGLRKSDAVGAGSDASAHLFCAGPFPASRLRAWRMGLGNSHVIKIKQAG
jgi:hypothetical protein